MFIRLGKRVSTKFYGMSSRKAMDMYAGGRKDYRACEGKEVLVPSKWPVKDTIQEIAGGIRSAYVGASRLKDVSKCTTVVTCHRTHNTIYESKFAPSVVYIVSVFGNRGR